VSSLACLRAQGDVVLLHVKAQPRASRNEIGEVLGTELKIKIAAPPVDSAANEMLIKFLAEVLGCPKSKVQLMRGASSRHKTVAIHGMTLAAITNKLCAAGCG
jgi:uncharacterized protein